MASIDYGMYGFNVLNVNGETADLPICTLMGSAGGSLPRNIQFTAVTNDPYKMALTNGAGTYTAIRTPISGLWEIEFSLQFTGGAGAGGASVSIYVDKNIFMDSSGIIGSAGGTNGYLLDGNSVVYTDTSRNSWLSLKVRSFLEKDCYVYLYGASQYGTAPAMASNNYHYFSMKCVSPENQAKNAAQTL